MDRRDRPEQREDTSESKERSRGQEMSTLEYIVASLGLLLVLGAVGYLVYHALWVSDTPPDPRVTVDEVVPQEGRYLVRFTATNQGDQTAAGLRIEGEIVQDGQVLERTGTTLDYLPAQSSRSGGLFFSHDPSTSELRVYPASYEEP